MTSLKEEKRPRARLLPSQLERLEKAFVIGERKKGIARELNMSEERVRVWFSNRRKRNHEVANSILV